MEEQNVSPASEPNADQRISELENKLADVNRRYAASSEEGKRLAQTVQNLQQAYEPPRQSVPNRRPWEEKLDSLGVPVDAIRDAIDERAAEMVQRQFEPITRALGARQEMVGRYKDYNKFESDMMGFVNSDPQIQQTYNQIFAASPVGAFEYAYLKFGAEQRGKRPRNGAADEDMAEAQIPTNRTGDARRAPRGNEGEVQEAARAYNQNPNPRNAQAYAKARLKSAIPDEFLNQ